MAMRSRTTFKKRQKELARQEKQRDKAARRVQRKLEKNTPGSGDDADTLDGDTPDGETSIEDGDDVMTSVAPSAAEPHSPLDRGRA